MSKSQSLKTFAATLEGLSAEELRRLLIQEKSSKRLGLVWEQNEIERDKAINSDVVLPALDATASVGDGPFHHLVIEGDNFDALRLLRATHANKIRVIFIDPPYNTGSNDWVYNDHYVDKNDRWRHSEWLEFLYQRLVLARDLLTPDGVIMVCIDDDNRAKLDLLMEQVFPGGRKGSFVWRVRSGGNDTKGSLLSLNHEHVLVYANEGFAFNGDARDEEAFDNPDNDERGPWTSGDLNKAHTAKQRPEAYYHIQNPKTGIWYLGDPDSVWRFASLARPQKKKLQADPIEVILQEDRVLWPANEETITYGSVDEIKKSIKAGTAPKQMKIYSQLKELEKAAVTDAKIARLLTYIEPIENWVGRTIGYGKPRYKRFRSQLKRDVTPLSSWLNPAAEGEAEDEEDNVALTVGATAEGTSLYKKLLGNKDFPYPKPLSLLMGLLDQATKKGDTVLDFFAGSATTAHAVLALNSLDGGSRRFIMVSSTEATSKEPTRNVCRDIAAKRVAKVIELDGSEDGFGYLKLDKYDPADVRLDATHENARQLLAMRVTGGAMGAKADPSGVELIGVKGDEATVFVAKVTTEAIAALGKLPYARLIVYCPRPSTVSEFLSTTGKTGVCYSIMDAVTLGQAGGLA